MVLEALAAVGLAGNIVQFVTFCSDLLGTAKEIRHSYSGLASENVELQTIARHLQGLTEQLQEQAHGLHDPSVVDLVEPCKQVSEELLSAIQALESHWPKGESRGWRSLLKALKSAWGQKRIAAIHERLDKLRKELSMTLVSQIQ